MGVPIPSGEITNKKDKDSLIIQRKTSSGWQSSRIDVDTFAGLIGSVGTSTPAVYETLTNDNYTITRAVTSSGEFEIHVKYKVGFNTDFIANLLEIQPAHVYMDRYIDVVVETWDGDAGDGVAIKGSWTMNRFYDNITGITNLLQGWSRSDAEILVNTTAFTGERYYGNTNQIIDLSDRALSFGFSSTVPVGDSNQYAWRIASFRGVLIKDNLI